MKARLALHRPSLSLKWQLRIGIVTLVTFMVLTAGLVAVQVATEANFADAIERAQSSANQVRTLVELRVNEKAALAQPPPANREETVALWERLVKEDDAFPDLLEKTLGNSNAAVEIMVCNREGTILATSSPEHVGLKHESLPSFAEWQARPFINRFIEVFTDRRNYEDVLPLGAQGDQSPALTIRVVVSSIFLWNAIKPQIENLSLVILATLVLSIILAALYSNVMVASLARLSERIEALAMGTFQPGGQPDQAGKEAKEFAAVQSKLDLLGRQFQGAREDVGVLVD